MNQLMRLRTVGIFCVASLLAACGGDGGDGGGSNPPAATPSTGVFLDSAVQGLGYSTPSLSGTTDVNGTFTYNAGEVVTFRLFGQVIGESKGFGTLTPFDLQPVTATADPDYAINLLRFLQTMDTDGNAANGIALPSLVGTINFDQSTAAFETDAAVTGFVAANSSNTLVTTAAALAHHADTISKVNLNYQIDLRTLRNPISVITRDGCGGAPGSSIWSFTDTGATVTTRDNWIDCVLSVVTGTETLTYAEIDEFPCGPICTYAELNRIIRDAVDLDGRTYNMTLSHSAGSNVVRMIKQITHVTPTGGPGGTFRSVFSFGFPN